MAFTFRLEKIARYRQKLVDDQGREVAQALRLVGDHEARLRSIGEDITAQVSGLAAPGQTKLTVQEMMARTAWISHLEELREEIAHDLQHARQDLVRHRERLNELWQDLEVLKKLRSRQEQAWRERQAKRESRDLDEIGQLRAERALRSKVST